jgi:hypothetical protein
MYMSQKKIIVNRIYPSEGNVYLENEKISLFCTDEVLKVDAKYTVQFIHQMTKAKTMVTTGIVKNTVEFEITTPKLTDPGIYLVNIIDNNNRDVNHIIPNRVMNENLIENGGKMSGMLAMAKMLTKSANVGDSKAEQTEEKFVEYKCYPVIHPANHSVSFLGSPNFVIMGMGFSESSNILTYTSAIFPIQKITPTELTVSIPPFCGENKIQLWVETNGIQTQMSTSITYHEPVLEKLSIDHIRCEETPDIDIFGKFLGNDAANNVKVMFNDMQINPRKYTYKGENHIVLSMPPMKRAGTYSLYVDVCNHLSNKIPIRISPILKKLSKTVHYITGDTTMEEITLSGSGFSPSSKVFVKNIECDNVTFVDENTLTVIPPFTTKCGSYPIRVECDQNTSGSLPFSFLTHDIFNLSANSGYNDQQNALIVYGIGLIGRLTVCVGKNKTIIVNEYDDKLILPMQNQPDNRLGKVDVVILKNGESSSIHQYTYLSKIAYLSSHSIPIQKIYKVALKLNGNCESKNLKLQCNRMDLLPIQIESDGENSVATFEFPKKDYPATYDCSLLIDDVLSDTTVVQYIPQIVHITPEKIEVSDKVDLQITGYGFTPENDVYLKIDDVKYKCESNIVHQKQSVIHFPLHTFSTGGLQKATICCDVDFEIPLFVYPKIADFTFPAENNEQHNKLVVEGYGFSEKDIYVATFGEEDCVIEYISAEQLLVTLPHTEKEHRFTIRVKNRFKELFLDNAPKNNDFSANKLSCIDNIVIYEEAFTYPQILGEMNVHHNDCTQETVVTISGSKFEKNTGILINGEALSRDNIVEVCDEHMRFAIPPTYCHKKHVIKTVNPYGVASANAFYFTSIPVIESVAPAEGSIRGGNEIYLQCVGLNAEMIYSVWWDGVSVKFVIEEQRIILIVPVSKHLHAGSVNLWIQMAGGMKTKEVLYHYLPQIDSLNPSSGYIIGGNSVAISGYGFSDETVVVFGNAVIDHFHEMTDQLIVFTVPPSVQGEMEAMVSVEHTGKKSNSMAYHYQLPTIRRIEKSTGFIAGGEEVVIYGEGFYPGMEVLFGQHVIRDFLLAGENTATFTTPPAFIQETVDVNIRAFFKSPETGVAFAYHLHRLSDISPNQGVMQGGYEVTITGEGFAAEDVYVMIGPNRIEKAAFTKHTGTQIEFRMPPAQFVGKHDVDVYVNNNKAENSLAFTYASRITSLSQMGVNVNTKSPITIYGDGFTGTSVVKLGTIVIQNVTYNVGDGSLTFITPHIGLTQTIPITVETNDVVSNAVLFTIKPILKGINPSPWIAEDVGFMYLLGEGFSSSSTACVVGIENVEPAIITPIKITNTTIAFAMPYIKKSGEITVAVGTSNGDENTWVYRKVMIYPKITKLSQESGPITGNNKIEIIGKGFHSLVSVKINDDVDFLKNDKVQYVNENTLIVTMPPSKTLQEIKLSVWCDKAVSNYMQYTYTPFIRDIKPNYSTLLGGTKSVISGEGIDENTVVLFNKKPIDRKNVAFDQLRKEIHVEIPRHFEVENISVKLSSQGFESDNFLKFFYTPSLETISLTHTTVAKQEIVTITGDGFCENVMIKIGDKFMNTANILKITNESVEFKLPIIDAQGILDLRAYCNAIPTSNTKSITFSAELTNIIPHVGPVAGGVIVNIIGYGFNDEITVLFNDHVIEYTIVSHTHLTIVTPKNICVVGINKISLKSKKYATDLVAKYICYPTITHFTQKYNEATKRMKFVLYGNGFSPQATVSVGAIENIVPIYANHTLTFEIDESYETDIVPAVSIVVTVNSLKSHDEMCYSNVPVIDTTNRKVGEINGGEEIVFRGSGFDKDSTVVVLVEQGLKIAPFFSSANMLKFYSPKQTMADRVHFVVESNGMKSQPVEFTYSPCIYSSSETYCNVGEEIVFKIYGDGFENYNTDIVAVGHGKCKIMRFVNNKILEIKFPRIRVCGIVDIRAETRNIVSTSNLPFYVKPVILSIDKDYANVNGGNMEIAGLGITSANMIKMVYKNRSYECSKIKRKNDSNREEYDKIVVYYDSIVEWKEMMKQDNLEYITIQLVVIANEVESEPFKWAMKNIDYNPDADDEVIKAIVICNNYLSSNYAAITYKFLNAYSDVLTAAITEMILKICELPGVYLHVDAERILIEGFHKIAAINDNISEVIKTHVIMRLVRILIDMLSSGQVYETIMTIIDTPLTVSAPVSFKTANIKYTDYDYLFQDCVEYVANHKSFNVLDARELSKCICFRVLPNDAVEFKCNEEILRKICDNFNETFMKKKFILCNNGGRFQGTSTIAPEGSIPDLFIYKLTSMLVGFPQQSTPLIDVAEIKSNIVDTDSALSLGNQLRAILTNNTTLKTMYDQFVKENTARFINVKNDASEFTQMPFQRGDKLMVKLFITGKIKYADIDSQMNIRTNELFHKACDPDANNSSSAFDYLLNNDATEIRATNDCYEITMG